MSHTAELFTPDTRDNASNETGIVIACEPSPLAHKIAKAEAAVTALLQDGKALCVASSFGKDSSVLLNITLQAAKRFVDAGNTCPPIVVVHSDTLIENPVMHGYARAEIAKVERWAAANGLADTVRVDVVSPNLSQNYLVNIIGGRTVIVTGAQDAKCSQDLKVTPIRKHKRRLFQALGQDNVVTLVGTRFDESAERARAMSERGESAHTPILNQQDEWLLSAIAEFTTDEIFTYIGQVRAGNIDCYSGFDELLEVYRDANGGMCEVIAHVTGQAGKTPCGARTGCFACTRVSSDSSMENMIAEEKHAWMRPLFAFRQYLLDTFYDPGRRNWLARSVDDEGQVNIKPNAYSPEFCEELLRIVMTIDCEEQEAAAALGIEPRFQLLSESMIVGIEMLWARYGYHDTAKAMSIFDEICNGARYPVPVLEKPFTREDLQLVECKVPFMDADSASAPFAGLRDVEAAMAGVERTVDKNGRLYSDVQTDIEFTIDEESAALFFGFEYDHFMDKFAGSDWAPHQVAHYFLRLGTVRLSKGGHSEWDRMLRMASRIHQLGLRPYLNDPEQLRARLGSEEGLASASGQLGLL